MKVAILTTHWIGSHGTGVPRYIMNLVKEFEKDDELEVSVLYMHGNDRDNYKIHGSKYSFPLGQYIFCIDLIRMFTIACHGIFYIRLISVFL